MASATRHNNSRKDIDAPYYAYLLSDTPQDAVYLGGAAYIHDAAVFGQHDAELCLSGDNIRYHLAIPFLEDMQRQGHGWQQYQRKREQGKKLRVHNSIISAAANRLWAIY